MKKNIPIRLLEILNKHFPLAESQMIEVGNEGDSFFILRDKDPSSDFFFSVSPYKEYGKFKVSMKPRNDMNNDVYIHYIDIKGLDNMLAGWKKRLEYYNSVNTIFDDPILQKYFDEFYLDFEEIEKPEYSEPFNLEKQFELELYLQEYYKYLEEHKTPENKDEVAEIQNDVHSLSSNIGRYSKRDIAFHLLKIYSKTRKLSIKLIREVYSVAKKKVIGFFLKEGYDLLTNLLP